MADKKRAMNALSVAPGAHVGQIWADHAPGVFQFSLEDPGTWRISQIIAGFWVDIHSCVLLQDIL